MTLYRFLKLYIFIAFIFSLFSVLYLPSYYDINLTETISYYVSDSWCPQSEDGIGYHCFGDFYYNFTVANSQNPWATSLGIPYPPLSIYYSKPFTLIGNYFGNERALILNLVLSIFSLLSPIIFLRIKKIITNNDVFIQTMIIILSSPVIMVLDRGNNIVILFPFLFFLYYCALKSNYKAFSILLLFCVLYRPQFILFILIFLHKREFKQFFKLLFLYILSILSSFILYPSDIFNGIKKWISSLTQYDALSSDPNFWPVNYSLRGSLELINHMISSNESSFNMNFAFSFFNTTFIIGCFTLFLILVLYRSTTPFEILVLLTLLSILAPGLTYQYYLIFLLIPLIYVINFESFPEIKITISSYSKYNFLAFLGYFSLFLPLFPLLIPISSFSYLNSPNSSGLIAFSKFGGIFVLMSFVLMSLNIVIRSVRSTIAND